MTENRQCPKCGTELSPEAAQGLCPKCLLDAGFESQAANAAGDDAAAGSSRSAEPSDPASAETIPPGKSASGASAGPYLEWLARQFPQLDNIENLGQGGMGVVYKARQRHLNRLVAVKLLSPKLADDPSFAERFTREAQALARLNQPNIVQVYDFGQTDQFFYFVMEYVDGVNLRALIHDGKLNPEEALKIVPQICEALQFAHDEGIVHRDIKPENILIDKRGRVKIADFGLAKLLGEHPENLSLTGTGQLMGTLGYMAPEQLQQAHAVDHRADIYSLGVVFYEMLTGQLPIGRFEPPSKKVLVDVRLDEVVLRSLENEPTKRYQHASEVKTDVEGISRSGFGRATPASAGHVSGMQRKLQGLRWFLICVNLAVVALSVALGEKSGDFGYTWTNPIEYAIKTVIIRYPVGAAVVLASLIVSFGLYFFVSGWLKRDSADEASVQLQATIDARGRVKWPANGLLITGLLDCLTMPILFYLAVDFTLDPNSGVGNPTKMPWPQAHYLGLILVWTLVVLSLSVGIGTILGALKMRRLESYKSAVAAAFLPMIPRFPVTWLCGLAHGIWSLIVLAHPEVKAGFASLSRDEVPNGPRTNDLQVHESGLQPAEFPSLSDGTTNIKPPGAIDVKTAVESLDAEQRSSQPAETKTAYQGPPPGVAQVRIPAIGLIITGALHMAGLALVGRTSLIELLILVIPITAGALIALGGVRMLLLQSYSWATTASILAILSVGPGWLLGLPMGIWSLVVLNRPEVKAVFAENTTPTSNGRIAPKVLVGLLLAVCVIGLVIFLAFANYSSNQFTARIDSARSIIEAGTREQALKTVALDAAAAGDAESAMQALRWMIFAETKDDAASQCAVKLAELGQRSAADDVVRMISYQHVRDETLRKIAELK